MRRLLIGILGLTLPGLFVLSTNPAPADAATRCWVGVREMSIGPDIPYRNCQIISSTATGEWEVYIGWDYRTHPYDSDGIINVTMDDRPSAYCTAVRVRFVGHGSTAGVLETQWVTACNGSTKSYNIYLQDQGDPFYPYEDGTYFVDFCDGKRPATCINKWHVDAGDTHY